MAWISKKKRIAKLEEKVGKLGREKFPEELPENIKEQIRGIVRSETKKLSDGLNQTREDLNTTNTQLTELTGKVKKFISSTREITKTVAQGVWNNLKEALGKDFFEEKPEEPKQQETAEDEQG